MSSSFLWEHRVGDRGFEFSSNQSRFDVLWTWVELLSFADGFSTCVVLKHGSEVWSLGDENTFGGWDGFEDPDGAVISHEELLCDPLAVGCCGLFQVVSEQEIQSPVALSGPIAEGYGE